MGQEKVKKRTYLKAAEKRLRKTQVIKSYLAGMVDDSGLLPPCNELMSLIHNDLGYKTTYTYLMSVAREMGCSFKPKQRRPSSVKIQEAQMIRTLIENDPHISYQAIADELGYSRQYVHQLCERFGIEKESSLTVSPERINLCWEMVRHYNSQGSYPMFRAALKSFGISYSTFYSFMERFPGDAEINRFYSSVKHYRKGLMLQVKEMIENTDLNFREIAEIYGCSNQYVSCINKKYSCRPPKRKIKHELSQITE